MKGNRVIIDIELLTPEWLTSIFKKKGYLNQGKVTKIIKKNSQLTLSSNVYFLEIHFSRNAQTIPASPGIFVKIPRPNDVTKFLGKHETKFYNIIAETLNEKPIPNCYDAAFSEETGLSHIILENLSDTHIDLPPVPPSKQYCERAIDCIAELHAFWWNHHILKDLSKHSFMTLKLFSLIILRENSFNEKEVFDYFKSHNKLLKQYSKKFFGDRISDERKELFKTVFSQYPQLIYNRMKKRNITIIHNDAHFWNFLYPKDMDNEKNKACLTDWASWGIGVGCQDVAFLMGVFLSPESRCLMEKDLIKRYYNKLLKFGVENYSWDECWYDYKFHALLNLYRVIEWWYRRTPSKTLWPLVENSICTIEDLNCMDLLEN
ncbi:MAG: oxidoreductase family protein [Promethearchaeota archaeon]|jgi:thiamine kinase-like enzyme